MRELLLKRGRVVSQPGGAAVAPLHLGLLHGHTGGPVTKDGCARGRLGQRPEQSQPWKAQAVQELQEECPWVGQGGPTSGSCADAPSSSQHQGTLQSQREKTSLASKKAPQAGERARLARMSVTIAR